MFTTIALILLLAVSAIVFVTATGFRAPPRSAPRVPETGYAPDAPETEVDLLALARDLLARYGIAVESRLDGDDCETVFTGRSADPLIGGVYIIVCRRAARGEIIPSTRLLEFRDEVKASGATKGVFLTNGFFTSDARYLLEDAPVSLVSHGGIADLAATLDTPLAAAARGPSSNPPVSV